MGGKNLGADTGIWHSWEKLFIHQLCIIDGTDNEQEPGYEAYHFHVVAHFKSDVSGFGSFSWCENIPQKQLLNKTHFAHSLLVADNEMIEVNTAGDRVSVVRCSIPPCGKTPSRHPLRKKMFHKLSLNIVQ